MKKRILSILLCIAVIICMMPATALAANGTGHQISVKIYKVVLDSSKPLGYQNPELVATKTVICQDTTAHSGYNHFVNLKEFYPTNFALSIKDWSGWQFNGYYEKGKDKATFYSWTKDPVNATANVTGSEPYPCSKNFYLVYKEAEAPSKPTENDLGILGKFVTVDCVNDKIDPKHDDKTYGLLDDSYTIGEPTKGADGTYTCIITLDPAEYVKHYNADIKTDHTLQPAEQTGTITLTWDKEKGWTAPESLSVTFKVICKTPEEPGPDKPTADELEDILDEFVTVDCTNSEINPEHATKTYGLLDGGYEIGAPIKVSDGTYTSTITLKPDVYVGQYNTEIGTEHTLHPADQTGTITLTWDKEKETWTAPESHSVTFKVICVTPEEQGPAAPTDEDLEGILSDEFVTVECINTNATHTPKKMTYGLLLNGYKVGAVTDADGKYTCNVTFLASAYQAQYNDDTNSKHVLDPVQQAQNNATITLTWNEDGGWSAPNPNGVKFTVRCEEQQEEQTYTVTYTDGVDGQVIFADQVTNNLKSGDATPAFKGTPTRDGYTFTGWNPAVAEKVTGNATYTAKWSKNETGGGGGTVTYYTVKWNNYDNTTLETDYCTYGQMPKYDGATPVKPADDKYTYEFIGWDKEVVKVTGNAVYTAQFKAVAKEPADPVNPADPTDPTKPEKPAKPEKPQKPATPEASGNTDAEKSEVPKTADANDLMLWAALLLAAGTGLAGTALRKRKADSGK